MICIDFPPCHILFASRVTLHTDVEKAHGYMYIIKALPPKKSSKQLFCFCSLSQQFSTRTLSLRCPRRAPWARGLWKFCSTTLTHSPGIGELDTFNFHCRTCWTRWARHPVWLQNRYCDTALRVAFALLRSASSWSRCPISRPPINWLLLSSGPGTFRSSMTRSIWNPTSRYIKNYYQS